MSDYDYHTPVMLKECIEGLNINPSGTYVDVTFGGGGHSREILKHLNKDGKLLAFDQRLEHVVALGFAAADVIAEALARDVSLGDDQRLLRVG